MSACYAPLASWDEPFHATQYICVDSTNCFFLSLWNKNNLESILGMQQNTENTNLITAIIFWDSPNGYNIVIYSCATLSEFTRGFMLHNQ